MRTIKIFNTYWITHNADLLVQLSFSFTSFVWFIRKKNFSSSDYITRNFSSSDLIIEWRRLSVSLLHFCAHIRAGEIAHFRFECAINRGGFEFHIL